MCFFLGCAAAVILAPAPHMLVRH